jgi:23S rRNA (adenine2503-C2)-methyltransferase
MNDITNLYGQSLKRLEDFAVEKGFKKFSGRQIYQWMYQKGIYDFEHMTNLSKKLRAELMESCMITLPWVIHLESSVDGAVKYLFELEDESHIEAVNIPDSRRLTLCISSQVGCPLGCEFCKTAQLGYERNLNAGEIVAQVALIQKMLKPGEEITNIVFMGMGEPFLNYDNLKDALEILTSELGLSIAHRKITVSTVGYVPGIYRLADENLKVGLAVSLTSADQKTRDMLMPVSKKFPLAKLREAIVYYTKKSRRRVTFEYLLISGITDTIAAAKKLVSFVADIPCKINLINYNPSEGLPSKFNYPRTPAVMIRASRGADISAACGQLAGKQR